jgi:hypothetical protein
MMSSVNLSEAISEAWMPIWIGDPARRSTSPARSNQSLST